MVVVDDDDDDDDDDDKLSQNLQECDLFSPDQTRDRGRIGRCNTLIYSIIRDSLLLLEQ